MSLPIKTISLNEQKIRILQESFYLNKLCMIDL